MASCCSGASRSKTCAAYSVGSFVRASAASPWSNWLMMSAKSSGWMSSTISSLMTLQSFSRTSAASSGPISRARLISADYQKSSPKPIVESRTVGGTIPGCSATSATLRTAKRYPRQRLVDEEPLDTRFDLHVEVIGVSLVEVRRQRKVEDALVGGLA